MGSQGGLPPLNLSQALGHQAHCSPSQQSPKALGWSIANLPDEPAHGWTQTKHLRSKCCIPQLCPDVAVLPGRGELVYLCLRSYRVPAVNQVRIYYSFSVFFVHMAG